MQELRDYLSCLFDEASNVERLDLTYTRNYVIEMLLTFVKSECIFNEDSGTPTLAWMYQKATTAPGSIQRVMAYRKLGDTALFISGFFNDHVERTPVGTGYYVDMGGAAYNQASNLSGSELFRELSRNFPSLVEVLIHMSDRTSLRGNQSIERLFERYRRNPGSMLLFDRLVRERAIPILDVAQS